VETVDVETSTLKASDVATPTFSTFTFPAFTVEAPKGRLPPKGDGLLSFPLSPKGRQGEGYPSPSPLYGLPKVAARRPWRSGEKPVEGRGAKRPFPEGAPAPLGRM